MAAGSVLGLLSWLLWPVAGLLERLGAADTLTVLQHAANGLCADRIPLLLGGYCYDYWKL